MRLNAEHVEKVAVVTEDGDGTMKLDLQFMMAAFDRLNMWERGLLHQVLSKAACAIKKTPEQRILLAMFSPRDPAIEFESAQPVNPVQTGGNHG